MLLKDFVYKKFILIFRMYMAITLIAFAVLIYSQLSRELSSTFLFVSNYSLDITRRAIFNDNLFQIQSDLNKFGRLYQNSGYEKIKTAVLINDRVVANYGETSSNSLSFSKEIMEQYNAADIKIVLAIDYSFKLYVYSLFFLLILTINLFLYYLLNKNIKHLSSSVSVPIEDFKNKLNSISSDLLNVHNLKNYEASSTSDIEEILKLKESTLVFINQILNLTDKLTEESKDKAFKILAKQVAHDIRSPLFALSAAVSKIPNLEGPVQKLIANSITRINTIADDLLLQTKTENLILTEADNFELGSAVEQIVKEKEVINQVKIRFLPLTTTIKINSSVLDKATFQRLLSNLINNSIEAKDKSRDLNIVIRITEEGEFVNLRIEDNGKGIPKAVLGSLGLRNISYGKQSGNGLGLMSAKAYLDRSKSIMTIDSEEGVGTTITIKIRKQ